MEILQIVYKFRWKRKRTIKDGCPCLSCGATFPKGTLMYVKYNRWNNRIVDSRCAKCYEDERNRANP